MTFLVLVSGGLLLAGLGLAGYGLRELRRSRTFRAGSALADAEVVDVAYRRPRTTANPRSGLFHPVVRFRTASGQVVEAPTVVGATPAPAKPGDRVQVRYDPSRPRQVELARGATSSTLARLLVAAGVAVAVFSGFVLVVAIVLYRTFA
ncbi:DUF3592 domain-containing protein [Nocardioides caldifontis]|uniref:DUF3592 domain-containing protein n=1 Tax=Nocardioides caldifontis TaxID=2588938 RepID=UPI0013967929|nr:DUF3592 domain-containing protein [Nocardioides caldifontis]